MPTKQDWIYELYVKERAPKLLPTDFYYDDQGRKVMTEAYHKKRGYCCNNKCKHCPYRENA
jgi:hypothetical protein